MVAGSEMKARTGYLAHTQDLEGTATLWSVDFNPHTHCHILFTAELISKFSPVILFFFVFVLFFQLGLTHIVECKSILCSCHAIYMTFMKLIMMSCRCWGCACCCITRVIWCLPQSWAHYRHHATTSSHSHSQCLALHGNDADGNGILKSYFDGNWNSSNEKQHYEGNINLATVMAVRMCQGEVCYCTLNQCTIMTWFTTGQQWVQFKNKINEYIYCIVKGNLLWECIFNGINEDGAALHVITDAAQEAGAALSVIAC